MHKLILRRGKWEEMWQNGIVDGKVATQSAMGCRGMGSAEEEGQGTTVGAKHSSDQSARERVDGGGEAATFS